MSQDSTATKAMIRDQLAVLRRRMRREAAIDEAVCRLAARMNLRPDEAADHLRRLSRDSGIDLLEVARDVTPPPLAQAETREPVVPAWMTGVLEALHASAAYLVPVKDAGGRVVDFLIAATNRHTKDVTGRGADQLRGRRLVETSPGVVKSGVLDDYLSVYESGAPLTRGPLEYVEARDGLLWPASIMVRAVRAGDGVLASWRTLDDEERLVAGWERAQRIAELGWGEWNLATGTAVWTQQMYEMFGRRPAEGPIRLEDLPAAVVAEDVPLVDEQMRTLLRYREATENEYRVQNRYGLRHLRTVSEPILDEDGLPVKIRMLVQDTTAGRRRERALAVAHEQAVTQRQRAEEEHQVAVRLQDSILPRRTGALDLPGLRMGLRYRPAEDVPRLGGDWFKARPLPDGRVLLAIGDAMGHGLTAVGLMAQMRYGLAGLAYTKADAAQLATWLNDLMYHNNEGVTATGTAIIGHFDPADRTLTWTSAGHPSPVLVRQGKATLLDHSPGVMLGAFESMSYELTTTVLESGDVLVLYTDGIVERRGLDVQAGLDALVGAAGDCHTDDPEESIACVLARLDGDISDDVCVIALRVL
ncbi:SpoIIE family protein phosphatase [Nonomuraea recticatena]|uniref:SpoIIE family protein phosphatase n=1 Tax=Nonomuraea recticatena TaxID=46178 RepID=UPI0031F86FC5